MNPEAALGFLKELTGLIRDWRDPAKRDKLFRLHLEKRAYTRMLTAQDYIHTANQYIQKIKPLVNFDSLDKEEKGQLRRLEKYLVHYEKKFNALR